MIHLLLLLLAAGPSGSLSGGRVPTISTNTIYIAGSSETPLSLTAFTDVAVLEARWVTLTTGIDGGTMSVSLRDDGAAVCTISVACSAPPDTVVVQACTAFVLQGSAVTLTVDRDACILGSPTGNLSYTVQR
jgi:hypothetical protein